MKFEYIEPVVTSTITVLTSILQSKVDKGELALRQEYELMGDVAVVILLQDDSGESIILNMDTKTALGICSSMNDAAFESLDPLAMDTLGEVANMIAGNAVSALNDNGFDFRIHPPTAVGRDDIPRLTKGLELLQVPVLSDHGNITVNFTMRTN
jgi:chemotaxis protein CheX